MEQVEDVGRLLDGCGHVAGNGLARLQGVLRDGLSALYHELEHEAAHLASLAVLCGVVP